MQIDILHLDRLSTLSPDFDAVVVIDVLRSFSTAAYAFAAGTRTVYPVEGPAAAFALARQRPRAVLIGALAGGWPIPGFDFANSPSKLGSAHLDGKNAILTTAAGVRGLLRYGETPLLFGSGLCNAAATAQAVLAAAPERVALLVTGAWVDRDGDEDIACADYIIECLRGNAPNSTAFSERVRQSDFGRRFGTPEHPQLPAADLEACARADCFHFAMRADKEEGRLVLRPVLAA